MNKFTIKFNTLLPDNVLHEETFYVLSWVFRWEYNQLELTIGKDDNPILVCINLDKVLYFKVEKL